MNKEKVKSNIWEIAVAQNKTEHPAVFPYQLAYDHIKSWSNEGDLVVIPFAGSGSECVACAELNRNFIGLEINDKYMPIIYDRLSKVDGSINFQAHRVAEIKTKEYARCLFYRERDFQIKGEVYERH